MAKDENDLQVLWMTIRKKPKKGNDGQGGIRGCGWKKIETEYLFMTVNIWKSCICELRFKKWAWKQSSLEHYLSSSENKAKWPNPNGFKSVDRALHRYRRGHRFKSYTGLNFFQALFSLLLNQCSLLQRSLPCSESRLLKSKVYNSNVYTALTWLKRLRKNLSCSSECPTSYLLFLLFIYCCCLF